jgi:hypothetical protein
VVNDLGGARDGIGTSSEAFYKITPINNYKKRKI